MKQLPESLAKKITQREQDNALRKLSEPNTLVDFASNDYLGLSRSKAIFDAAHAYLVDNDLAVNGSTGSRLISGNHSLYQTTEEYIAGFHEAESALIFNSGYDANVGFFSSVPQKGDVVLYDEYIHASIRDGIRLSNANTYKFAHNSLEGLEKLVLRYREQATEIYVVTESVFSMDGDSPDLTALAALAEKYNLRLVIDEAHALGVFSNCGRGLVYESGIQESVFATLVTFGKGLGCHGAAILGSAALKQYLLNFARSFIYTTALPPHSLATILSAYKYLAAQPSEQKEMFYIVSFFKEEIKRLGLTSFINSDSAIHCAVVPGNEKVRFTASVLQQNGFNVKAILSPTVPAGQERLRFCLHSYTAKEQVTQVLELLTSVLPSS
jgi:8-amino-7-oxononanoate synthase